MIPDQATVILHAASPKKEERKKIRKLLNLRQTRSCKRNYNHSLLLDSAVNNVSHGLNSTDFKD